MRLDRFYPIFEDAAWVARMLREGVKLVQLRIKDKPQSTVNAQVKASTALCEEMGATLVVNDHWKSAMDAGAPWVHLGQEDLDIADVAAIRKAGLKLGISTHDDDELERALSLDADYIALGPVYPTILKKMRWDQQGLPKLTEWKERIGDTPLVAIGGMSVERASGAFDAGADIVAAVTDITLRRDPEARVREWLEVTR